jgi:lipopolysaccharide export system permease protein
MTRKFPLIAKAIWERYLLREILKVFLLFLGCFFFLYALIDYSMHMQDFIVDKRIQISHIAIYYFFHFIKRANLLIPLSLLVSTLKVLFALNTHGELIALQASGLSRKKLLRPFFCIGLAAALFNLASSEFLLPFSLNFLDKFRQEHFKHYDHGKRKEPIHVIRMKDGSKIIYQIADRENSLFQDVFWVQSAYEIWRMQSLTSDPKNPVGFYVDHLQRNDEGNFEKTESFEQYHFAKFRWQPDPTGKGYTPLENRRLSELLRMLLQKSKVTAYEYPQVLTHFLFKAATPFLSLVVVIAGAPFCLQHSRNPPLFLTYALALFCFIAFFALMDAAVILGENLVVSPYLAILAPIFLCWVTFGFKYRQSI